MGSVWEGVHVTLGTKVAVKFIEPTYAESAEARHRFENEARAAARLNSKYAVQVYDHGMTQDGRPFIVMEFLAGEPLDARLEREGRLSPADTAQIIMQVSRALMRAHAAGVLHRDLKPENVFLVWDEEDHAHVAKVVDFGIAKFTDNQVGISSSTRTGSVLGTPYYMSPEQARGLRTIDFRTDLWSLGVIAYRCIVGRLPFEGESVGDLLVKICTADLPTPSLVAPGCPLGFDAWFWRALQRDPNERFASAQELAEQLMMACGLATARTPMSSAQLGYASDQGAYGGISPNTPLTTDGGVAGVTVQNASKTHTVFSHTGSTSGSKKSTVLWVAGGLLAIFIAGALIAVFVRRSQVDEKQMVGRDPQLAATNILVNATSVGGTYVAPQVRALSPAGVAVVPAVSAVAPVDAPVTSTDTDSHPGPKSVQSTKSPPVVAKSAASTRGTPPASAAQPPRRPPAGRAIDVGY
jgi:serine/threonine protein kinase